MPHRLGFDLEGERAQRYAIFAFAFLVFFAKLWEGPLSGDESCYALLARQILRSGDWVVLHHPVVPEWASFYDHPPLYMWLTALNFKVFGMTDFAAKMASAFTGFATIVTVYFAARRMSGHRFAVLASGLLVTSLYFVDYGRKARLENPLTFFLFLSFGAMVFALKDRRPAWSAAGGAALALAFLTKGAPALAGVAICGFAIIFYADTWRRRVLHLVMFGVGASAVIVPWALMQSLLDDGRFFDWYLHRQVSWSVTGRVDPAHHRARTLATWLFYFKALLTKVMVPGAALGFLGALWVLWQRRFRQEYFEWVAVVAVLVVVGGFAAIPHQQDRYVLPAVPFLALLGARFLCRFSWSERLSGWTVRFLAGASGVLLLVAALTPIRFYTKKDGDFLPFCPFVERACAPSDSILVGGVSPYTSHQVFTWYFDRPQKLTRNADEFVGEWQSRRYAAAIYRTSGPDEPPPTWDFLPPFARSGRYLLFLADDHRGTTQLEPTLDLGHAPSQVTTSWILK